MKLSDGGGFPAACRISSLDLDEAGVALGASTTVVRASVDYDVQTREVIRSIDAIE